MPVPRRALPGRLDATVKDKSAEQTAVDPRVEARKRRLASLRSVAGIWADRTDIPADGLQYERDLRDEWR
jgi:hypothetical protein